MSAPTSASPAAPARNRAAVRPTMATLFTLVFALGGWRSGLTRLSDNSFFWHLRTGRRILDEGIPRVDPYSFTAPGTAWVAQSWLAEVIYGAIDWVAGPFGVRLLGAVTGALVAGLTYRLALRLALDRVVAVGVTLAAVGASFTLWSERPLFLGILAFVVLLWVVEVPESKVARHPLLAIPVLMWLWANVHGTFSLGFAYLALHLAGRWLDGAPPWRGRERELLKASVLAGLVCLANPYGLSLLLFPLELLSRGEILQRVTEWRSPDFRTPQGLVLAAWTAVYVAAVALGRQRPSRRDMLVSVPFLLLAFWAQRNIAVAPLVGLPVVARAVASRRERPETSGRLNRAAAALVVVMALLWTAEAAVTPDFATGSYPVRAMRFVDENGLIGRRLMTDDAWGGYLILRWWPEQRVFVDDRYDMYPVDVIEDFIEFSDAAPSWNEILERRDIEVVVWKRGTPVGQLLERAPEWERVYRDRVAVVFVRRDVAEELGLG